MSRNIGHSRPRGSIRLFVTCMSMTALLTGWLAGGNIFRDGLATGLGLLVFLPLVVLGQVVPAVALHWALGRWGLHFWKAALLVELVRLAASFLGYSSELKLGDVGGYLSSSEGLAQIIRGMVATVPLWLLEWRRQRAGSPLLSP